MSNYRPPIIFLESTASTNAFAQELLKNHKVKDKTVVATWQQQSGKGQRGNSWHSGIGENLTFSIIFLPHFLHVSRHFLLNKVFSLAIKDFLLSENLSNVTVKWPNDVMVSDSKIAGILLENAIRGEQISAIVAGIGINVNMMEETEFNAVSMKKITGKTYVLEQCLYHVLDHIFLKYELLDTNPQQLNYDYIKSLYRINALSTFRSGGESWKGIIRDVCEDGSLEVENIYGGRKVFAATEIRLVPDNA